MLTEAQQIEIRSRTAASAFPNATGMRTHPPAFGRPAVVKPPAPAEDEAIAWKARAACRGMDPEWFFPERGDHDTLRSVIAVCTECPVRIDCLDYALAANEKAGVWGGTTGRQRRRMTAGQR